MNTKESTYWYVEYWNTPNGVYNRIFMKQSDGKLVYHTDVYTKEPVSLKNGTLKIGE